MFHQVLPYTYPLPTLYSTKSCNTNTLYDPEKKPHELVEDRLVHVDDALVADRLEHVEDALVEDRLLLVEDALVDDQQDALLRGRPGGPRAKPA